MKFLTLLNQDPTIRQNNKAVRAAKAVKRKQESLIDSLEARKDEAADALDKLKNVTLDNLNQETWAADYHAAQLELQLIDVEIKLANETLTELFGDAEETT